MRVVQVISGFDPLDGGPYSTLPNLWSELKQLGVELRIHTTSQKRNGELAKVPVTSLDIQVHSRFFPSGFRYSPQIREKLMEDLTGIDICHSLGCWLYPNWVAGRLARQAGKPLVITPLGHLEPWSLRHHAVRKMLARWLWEGENWRYCSAWIAKSEFEAEHLRQLGLAGDIAVIPNGLHAEEWGRDAAPDLFYQQYPALEDYELVVFLSRIDPKKGVQSLLEVWKKLCDLHRGWHLVIAGENRHAYGQLLMNWVQAQGIQSRVTFTGSLEGELKRALLAAGKLFVLPSQSENFGQAILEALAAGIPVIATRECPWPGIERHRCGYWIETHQGHLESALQEAMRLPIAKLEEMGKRGKEWVLRDFEWKGVAEKHHQLYAKVAG